ncbi:extracellular solute-binding protein [Sphaerisporangium corydalis]|uniref:extracellular solute-binding protein n=1 Tax=Sphaerisporangium corydalis TaxID=1441875 RepID=UPI0021D13A7B|nr:extracellular solute-binding protein [Sphaerisporangium corydalis]
MSTGRLRTGLAAMALPVALAACAGPAPASPGSDAAQVAAAPSPTPPAATATPSPSSTPTSTPTPVPKSSRGTPGPGEGMLTVLTFRGYAEYGGSDPDVNWVKPFEQSTGCRVNLRFPQSGDQMDKLLAQTAFDVVAAPPEVTGRLIDERKVVPLTTSLISGYDAIPRWLRTQRSVTAGGKVYGVPFLWGSYVTLYDSGGARPAKGDAIYSDRGPVTVRNSPMSIADAALALKGRRPKLGVKDPFELTPAQLDAAMALLTERQGERVYWREPIEALQGLAGSTVRLGRALPYQLDILRRAGRPVKAVPDEPTTGWVDSWMVSAQATAPNCAYKWLAWTASAGTQRQAAAWNGLAPANPAACGGAAARVCAAYRVKDDKWLKKISFAVRPSKDCGGRHGECTDYAEWATRWQQLVR